MQLSKREAKSCLQELDELMRLRGWTVIKAAKALGVSDGIITHWRRGHRKPQRQTMLLVSLLLHEARRHDLADLQTKVGSPAEVDLVARAANRRGTPLASGKSSVVDAFKELYEAGGSDWDDIDDPKKFLAEVTGE